MTKVDDCNGDSGGRSDRAGGPPGSTSIDDPALIAGELRRVGEGLVRAVMEIDIAVAGWEGILSDVWVTYSGHRLECVGGQILFDGRRFSTLTRGKKLVAWDMMKGLLLAHYELPLPEHYGGASTPKPRVEAPASRLSCVSYDGPSDERDMAIGDLVYAACGRFPEVARSVGGRREIWFEAPVSSLQAALGSMGLELTIDSRGKP